MDNQDRAAHLQGDCVNLQIDYERLVRIVADMELKSPDSRAGVWYASTEPRIAPVTDLDEENYAELERKREAMEKREHDLARLKIQERIIEIARFRALSDEGRLEDRRRISSLARQLKDALRSVDLEDAFILTLDSLSSLGVSNGAHGRPENSRPLDSSVLSRVIKLWRDVTPTGQRGFNDFVADVCDLLGLERPSSGQIRESDKRVRGVKKEKTYLPKGGGK